MPRPAPCVHEVLLAEGERPWPAWRVTVADIYYVTRVQADQKKGRDGQPQLCHRARHNGQRLWRVPAPGTVGAPAATGGPSSAIRELVILDGQNGNELTRIRRKDDELAFRAAPPASTMASVTKVFALLSESGIRPKKTHRYAEPKLGERVQVFLNWDGYRP